MSETHASTASRAAAVGDARLNRFTIQIATVNGSGSQTANNTLLRAIFRMGLPVSGKNRFPSNIQGLPTWFTIRVNEDGHTARCRSVDVLVCMNAATVEEDVMAVEAGTVVVYEESLKVDRFRDDLRPYAVPFNRIVREVCEPVALRKLVVNMIYVGVLSELLAIDPDEIGRALDKAFKNKPKALGLNRDAIFAGRKWVQENVDTLPHVRLERRTLTDGKILVDGNAAAAIGCLFAGVTVVAWYPITPSSSVAEDVTAYAARYRTDRETGRTTVGIVQAEDELAAIGMALGAGWAGARSMTATSGPGISLMSEFVGLGYYAEIPTVIFNVQRAGPSTGLPTRTMQGDLLSTAYLSHGDARHPCFYVGNIREAYEFSLQAFDLAELLQTPVFVLTDLDLGMNLWMADPFEYPKTPIQRGKVLDAEALAEVEDWGRYKDVDGDGIPYRTLPGSGDGAGAYFTRGSGHDEYAKYTENGEVYARNLDRLARKIDASSERMPGPLLDGEGVEIGVLTVGTCHDAVQEARERLREASGVETDFLRVRAFPFAASIGAWIAAHERVYVVEQNRDGQLRSMLAMDLPGLADRFRPVLHYDGLPLDAATVVEQVLAAERGDKSLPSHLEAHARTGEE